MTTTLFSCLEMALFVFVRLVPIRNPILAGKTQNMKTIRLNNALALKVLSACVLAATATAMADPPEAEDRGHRIAVQYRDRGFFVTPVDSGILLKGSMIRIEIPVTRGLDYVVIASGDEAAIDVDSYIYSEVDTLIINDGLSRSDAIVQFRAQYTGSVFAFIFMARVDASKGLPSYAAFVGRRGTAKTPTSGGEDTSKSAPTGLATPQAGQSAPRSGLGTPGTGGLSGGGGPNINPVTKP